MKLTNFTTKVFFSTVLIVSSDGETGTNIGTGFIVQIVTDRDSTPIYALVTCKHVLYGPKGSLFFTLHKRGSEPDTVLLTDAQGVLVEDSSLLGYFEHDDAGIDVAAVDITEHVNRTAIYAHGLLSTSINEEHLKLIKPGLRVFYAGYPSGRLDKKHNLPILRTGTIATIPQVDFEGMPSFLIDTNVHAGSSGSPVIVQAADNQELCLGMLGRSEHLYNDLLFENPKNDRKNSLENEHDDNMFQTARMKIATAYRKLKRRAFAVLLGESGVNMPIGLGVVYKPRVIADVLRQVEAAAVAREEAARSAASDSAEPGKA